MAGTERHQALLAAGGELVTATARQARALSVAFGRAAARQGRAVWPTPPILPYGAWLEREVRACDERPEILGGYAALRLWQLIVEASPAGESLVSVAATAAEAARAWALAHEWHIPIAALRPATPEEIAFRDWALEFERRTAARGALDAARLPAWLAARRGAAGPPAALGFHGFGAATPARASLRQALERGGRTVEELALDAGPARLARLDAATPEAECEAIAAWLAARLGAEPAARLLVIVPDLATRAPALRRLLDDRLAPALLEPGAPDGRPYALSIAPRLADHAVADAALGLVALGGAEVELLALGRLLRSPYLPAAGGAAAQRARLDVELRRLGMRALPAETLGARLRGGRAAEPEFAALVAAARAPLARRGRHSAADWAEAMQRALRAAGWPQGRALGTLEYQAAHAVNEALTALGGLAAILPPLDFAAAQAELRALVAATPVPPDAGDAPVLVLDQLEDPALPCDGLWVAGLTAERFPATAQPTPFLPLGLQRARGIPAASPAAALAAARVALAGWRAAAPELVLSAALRDGEARRARSPLVPEAPAPAGLVPAVTRAVALRAARRLEPWSDGRLPPLPAGERVAGGVRVLELMSQCPFRAGAELRLGARALETPRAGLPRRLRGKLAHTALATLWGELGSHAGLVARGAAGRRAAVTAAVDRALAEERTLPPSRLVELERDWLTRAIAGLAEIELARAPFEVAEIRVDRVDRLADGTIVVIDYKSGQGTPRRWAGPRPDPVQLPLYAAFRSEPPGAVALALLPLAKSGFVGLAARDGVLPEVRALAATRRAELRALDWPALLAGWREALTALALGYAAGAAAVDPAAGACEHCPLGALCRIAAPDLGPDEAAGEDDD